MGERGAVLAAGTDGEGLAGREEIRGRRGDLGSLHRELAECGHLVHDPEAAAVGGDGEVVAVDDDVADGGGGHVVLERVPVDAVVQADIDAELGGGVEEAFGLGVFLDGVDVGAGGDAGGDLGPSLAAVAGFVDVGGGVVDAVAIDGGVGGESVEVPASTCEILLQAVRAGGVTSAQCLPSSVVRWIRPSSVPTQTVVALSGEGEMV